MSRTRFFAHFVLALLVSTLFMIGTAKAQIFNGTTIDSGTDYDSQGFGTYNLSGGSLTLDGSSIFGGNTTIQWNVPVSGGTLEFESTLLTATDGDLSLTGNPVHFPSPFTLSNSAGSIEITGSLLGLPQGNILGAGSVLTISDGGSVVVLLGPPFSIPEPSTWTLLLGGMGLLVLAVRRKSAKN
jgi:hypothetical protein